METLKLNNESATTGIWWGFQSLKLNHLLLVGGC